ncbi:hypothetical protein ACOSP7_009304 [Xanthoceras sorbifolium]
MDNSSFPCVLEFKNKIPPDPLLLRLKSWFECYDFQTKHIKGSQNLIPDMLSRPKPAHLITPSLAIPLVYTFSSSMALSSSQPTHTPEEVLNFPARQTPLFPPSLLMEFLYDKTPQDIKTFALNNIHQYLSSLTEPDHSQPVFKQLNKLFLNLLYIHPYPTTAFTHNHLWYLRSLSLLYSHPVAFPLMQLYQHLYDPAN